MKIEEIESLFALMTECRTGAISKIMAEENCDYLTAAIKYDGSMAPTVTDREKFKMIGYDFPADYGGSKQARGWAGQKQQWFAFRFTGEESEIDLEAHGEIEFDAWRWGPLSEAPDRIVPFKRAVYEQVVAVFAPLVV